MERSRQLVHKFLLGYITRKLQGKLYACRCRKPVSCRKNSVFYQQESLSLYIISFLKAYIYVAYVL